MPLSAKSVLTEIARAKVNLWLEVEGQRSDGYHQLNSLAAFADYGDEVVLHPSPQPEAKPSDPGSNSMGNNMVPRARLTISGPFSAALASTDNLITKVVTHFLQDPAQARATLSRIELIKRLPIAAGLGGGSADAAAVIRLLAQANGVTVNEFLNQNDLSIADLARLIGADVPACLWQQTVIMQGIGDILTPVASSPDGPGIEWPAVLVNPGVPLSTKDVFAQLNAAPISSSAPTPPNETWSWPRTRQQQLALLLQKQNHLEKPARALVAEIDQVLYALAQQDGIELARLSGSGPTCFGLFASLAQARAAAQKLARTQPNWWVVPVAIGPL